MFPVSFKNIFKPSVAECHQKRIENINICLRVISSIHMLSIVPFLKRSFSSTYCDLPPYTVVQWNENEYVEACECKGYEFNNKYRCVIYRWQ